MNEYQAIAFEKVPTFMGVEVEPGAASGQFTTKRVVEVHKSPDFCTNWSLDLSVSFKRFRDERKTVNEAELFLLPMELPIFTQALITHPILLPTSYSQHLSMERGMYCVRLNSIEPFEDFAVRLSDGLERLV